MWTKRGNIYNKCHAQLPTVEARGDLLRIYYSTKNDKGQSAIRYFEVLADHPDQIMNDPQHDVLKPGPRGTFDDSGVMPSCIVNVDGHVRLYYTGWNTDKGQVPYGHGIGMAVWSESDGDFYRSSIGPVLDRCPEIPFLANSPAVIKMPDWVAGAKWKMWFCNGLGWDGDFPTYAICYAESEDGIRWKPHAYDYEATTNLGNFGDAYSRPTVLLDQNRRLRLWWSARHKTCGYYVKSAYAYEQWLSTKDPTCWTYAGSEWVWGLFKSDEGWDSEQICYPYIHRHGDRLYMFYNGNGYGATGIGWAEWTN